MKIEGIDVIAVRYKTMVDTFRKKNYDVLDHRKQDFDVDYVDFCSQIDTLQLSLQGFMDSWFSRNLSVSSYQQNPGSKQLFHLCVYISVYKSKCIYYTVPACIILAINDFLEFCETCN